MYRNEKHVGECVRESGDPRSETFVSEFCQSQYEQRGIAGAADPASKVPHYLSTCEQADEPFEPSLRELSFG